MNDDKKTKAQLMEELELLRKEIDELRTHNATRNQNEAEQQEERDRTLFDVSPSGIILEDKEGRVIDVNLAFCEYVGYTRDDLIGEKIHFLTHSDSMHLVDENIQRLLAGEELKHVEKSVRKDGTISYMELHERRIVLQDGEHGILCVAEDITARMKLEEELLRTLKLESLGVLAGGIAHDFNNLITGILGNISLAKMNLEPEDEVYELLTAAEKASSRTKALTQQLLTFAKGGAPVRKSISIVNLIKDATSFAIRGSNVRCNFSISADIWNVSVDEGQISQVIQKLIMNADQAMPIGGQIFIRCENINIDANDGLSLEDGKYVKISVQDKGMGIPEEHLNKIFDPYFTTRHSGSGLGLATAYSIVKKHFGQITVESELGKGTTFLVYLPASTAEKTKKISYKKTAEFVGAGKVLLMDDELIVRDVAGNILRHIGFEVGFAEDGVEAIDMYQKAKQSHQPFVAVLMDLTIPGGMGGEETIQELLKIDPNTKAIVSSGYADDPIMSNFKDYGFCDVLTKPYNAREIKEVFYNILGNVQ